ncbi:MAG: pseudouridine synthase [Nitrospinota bacterium]|nr:pseudouridine synthase [Nitrospinota bacterium]
MVRLHYLPPSEQVCESFVPLRYIGFSVIDYFVFRFPYLSREAWMDMIREGRVAVNKKPTHPEFVLKEHDLIVTRLGKRLEPPANREIRIMYEDQNIRVFNKAAPIPVHPSGRYYKNSMTELLKDRYPEERLRPVQRRAAATTGVVVFAKTREAATFLMHEFSINRVRKEYLAIVEGMPRARRFMIDAAIGKINGSRRGTGSEAVSPKQAVTRIQWLSSRKGRSLLKVVPLSGRTNQIRVHLTGAGLPIVNDPVYGSGTRGSSNMPLGLHAYRLSFRCFESSLEITAPWPEHFQPYLKTEAGNLEP